MVRYVKEKVYLIWMLCKAGAKTSPKKHFFWQWLEFL
jgi:hypothetical protein